MLKANAEINIKDPICHLNLRIVSERQQHFTHRVKGLFHICAFTYTGIYFFPLKVLRNGWPLIMFCLFQIQVYMASEEWQNKQINITKQLIKQVEHGIIVWEFDRMNDKVIYPYTRMNDEVVYPCTRMNDEVIYPCTRMNDEVIYPYTRMNDGVIYPYTRMNDEVIYPYTRMNDEVIYPYTRMND